MAQHDQASPLNIETLLVHGGRRRYTSSGSGTPTVPPIHASTTYLHDTTEALDRAFSGATPGGEPAFVYARQGNPNACALEEALARIEGGVGAVAFGSGMGAIHAALLAAGLAPGTKIVASQDLYGPTISLLRKVFMPAGVTVVLSDLCRPDVADFIRAEEPDVIYAETFSNPLVKVVDLDAITLSRSPHRAWLRYRHPQRDQIYQRTRRQHRRSRHQREERAARQPAQLWDYARRYAQPLRGASHAARPAHPLAAHGAAL
jgi:cystathionine gamma-synthase/methionine-gamma-lyase